jgi:cobalt/nickel transport system permease protein
MHIPDGFINAGTSAGAAVAAAGGIAVCLRKAAETLKERQVALAGLVSAFLFALQMLNFPVASGTSGHVIGGVLAAVLVGPWVGALCVSVVLIMQCLLFADGGLSALGLNIVNMALVATLGGWVVFKGIRTLLPATTSSVVVASGIAAFASMLLASVAFALEYALGGAGGVAVDTVATAMTGTHALIGVGEGIITAFTIGVVLAARPDIVEGAADLRPELEVRTSEIGANP